MAKVFISYASPDRPFALRLAGSLEELGHTAWMDVQLLQVGASIPRALAEAVKRAEYLIVVLSKQSAASAWSAHEWEAKYWDEVTTRQTMVLPVLLEECVIPLFLQPKRYADFRAEYAVGLAQLAMVLHEQSWTRALHGGSCALTDDLEEPVSPTYPLCYTDGTMNPPGRLAEVHVDLAIPYLGRIAGVWKPDEREQDAAWEMYVELATRIAMAELPADEGLLREGLSSLYGMFTTTRHILRTYGPAVARPKADSELSFGSLAIGVLNYVLRPVLTKWHPLLLDYEHRREASVSAWEHEAGWEHSEELRQALNQVRCVLLEYIKLLAHISRVPTVTPQ